MKNSAIQWTDHTFNPWEGCTKVAPECKNCYAETLVDHRFGRVKWGKGEPRRRTSENLWKQPIRWNAFPIGRVRPRVFCLSLGDWLDEEVPIEWLADLLFLIYRCDNLDWQLLTKRPRNWRLRLEAVQRSIETAEMFVRARDDSEEDNRQVQLWEFVRGWLEGDDVPQNIWIGVSAGADQKAALEIPAKVHFLSCEPMLHPLDTTHAAGFDWIIFGGESGKNARPCHVQWIRDGLAFCHDAGIAPFVKQLGAHPIVQNPSDWIITGHGIRDSHGGDMSEWPEDLRVREFPHGSNRTQGTNEGGAKL